MTGPAQNQAAAANPLMAGGKEVIDAEIWPNKGSDSGDTILGTCVELKTMPAKNPGSTAWVLAKFSPVVVYTAKGAKTAHADLAVIVGAKLSGRITPRSIGKTYALQFTGYTALPGNKQQREYEIREQSGELLAKLLDELGASELVKDSLPF